MDLLSLFLRLWSQIPELTLVRSLQTLRLSTLTPYSPSEKLVSNHGTNSEEKKYLPFTLNIITMSLWGRTR